MAAARAAAGPAAAAAAAGPGPRPDDAVLRTATDQQLTDFVTSLTPAEIAQMPPDEVGEVTEADMTKILSLLKDHRRLVGPLVGGLTPDQITQVMQTFNPRLKNLAVTELGFDKGKDCPMSALVNGRISEEKARLLRGD
eukprot:TRINITY_DN1630_c0_g1_i2.p3 TRINITY_DN1630_c0_g1~~TRINITY_DN1630_c0_g1_i2.p3  ORF type:complete len:139 (+),score=49.08 TRINITY_DN1630_c0_g1_i2:59-475(+)